MAVSRSKKDNPSPFVTETVEPLVLDVPEASEEMEFEKSEPVTESEIFFEVDEPVEEPKTFTGTIGEVKVSRKVMTKAEVVDAFMDARPTAGVGVASALTDFEALVTDVDEGVEFLTNLIYGKNGTGKTYMLSTAEGILIGAVEDGTLTVRGKLDPTKGKKVRIDEWSKLESLYFMLKNGINSKNEIWINTKTGKFRVKYIALDTLTKLFEVCIRDMIVGSRMKGRTGEIDLISKTLKDWGDATEKMKYWLQLFEELPCQRIWLCQETTNSEDVEAEEYSIYPALSKSLRNYVMSEADIIARTYISQEKGAVSYRLTAMPNAKFVTKDRTSKINSGAISSPNLTKIYNHIFKEEVK